MKKSMMIAIIAAAVIVPAAVYAASPLFVNTTIDEPAPTAAANSDDDKMMEEDASMSGDSMMDDKDGAAMADKGDETMMEDKNAMMMDKPLAGSFVGVGDGIHNAEGTAQVIYLDGSDALRLEEFRSTNGPDLYVYLSADKEATDFVDLGRLKANIGNQNYEIPEGTDLSKYNKVLIWCKSFSVLFGSAELMETPASA